MSKTNDTSKLDHTALEDHHTLADSELDAVSGGWPEFNYQENGGVARRSWPRGST